MVSGSRSGMGSLRSGMGPLRSEIGPLASGMDLLNLRSGIVSLDLIKLDPLRNEKARGSF